MHLVCVWLALLAAPFWETKAPADWTNDQIMLLLQDSPWAQIAKPDPELAGRNTSVEPAPEVQIYLATARPMRECEAELSRRREKPLNEEYLDYLAGEGANKLIIAIAFQDFKALEGDAEVHRMEEESIMLVGRQEYKMEGHFPPVPSDPFLRLVYPRAATERDKTIAFELYLPGYGPYHNTAFRVRDMMYKGKLEM
jgi:hypothetical protein